MLPDGRKVAHLAKTGDISSLWQKMIAKTSECMNLMRTVQQQQVRLQFLFSCTTIEI
jgi:hypothetical protein